MTVKNNNSNISRPARQKKFKHKKTIIVLSVIPAFILILIVSYFIMLKLGEIRLRNKLSFDDARLPGNGTYDTDDADAYYNGVAYDYNEDLINILLIGADKFNPKEQDSRQADALYLFSLDPKNSKVAVIGISRNTIAEMDIYNNKGDFVTTDKKQLCLAYGYGKNAAEASENTVKAVSKFLYNVPISGYYTIYMDSVKQLVDCVGGVPVVIDEDMTRITPEMKKGAHITLKGKNALRYLRFRNESNQPRLERQKAFILSYISSAKKATSKNLSLPITIFKKLASNTVTNIDVTGATYIASEALKADFRICNIQGTAGFDGTYETFVADEDQLYQLLLDVFYKKK